MPARPDGVTDEDIVRGLYRFNAGARAARRTAARPFAPRCWPAARSCSRRCARSNPGRARRRGRGLERAVVPAAAQRGARDRSLEQAPSRRGPPRSPLVTELLREPAEQGPMIAVSDFVTAWPDMISRWVPGGWWRSLGTDGFGAVGHARGAASLLRDRRRAHRGHDSGRAGPLRPHRRPRGERADQGARHRPGGRHSHCVPDRS